MVGAIAHLRGYTLDDPHTRTVILLTVAGSNLQAAASGLGVELGKQGGLVGGSVDAALTGMIGKAAKKAFASGQD